MHRVLACLLLLLAAGPARADCEVQGVASLDRLRVRLPGHRFRTFAVTDLPIAVRPGRGTRYRDVRVLAPIAFGARTDAVVPWTVPRPQVVADGMLWLTPRVEIESVRELASREGLVVRAQLDVGVWVDRLHVPCDAIAVGHGEGGVPEPEWGASGPLWAFRHNHAWVVSEPNDDDAATIRIDAPRGLRGPLTEVERRGEWVRVLARFASGALLRGWIRHHHLRASDAGETSPQPYRRAILPSPSSLCTRGRPQRDEYIGPAHISVGALVRWRREGDPWATVTEPSVFTVSWHHGSEWVRIVYIPGLRADGRCPEIVHHAWVPRRAVSLQGEPTARGDFTGARLGIE